MSLIYHTVILKIESTTQELPTMATFNDDDTASEMSSEQYDPDSIMSDLNRMQGEELVNFFRRMMPAWRRYQLPTEIWLHVVSYLGNDDRERYLRDERDYEDQVFANIDRQLEAFQRANVVPTFRETAALVDQLDNYVNYPLEDDEHTEGEDDEHTEGSDDVEIGDDGLLAVWEPIQIG